jgi:asparagine synthase (glutamine-hydrolysing)
MGFVTPVSAWFRGPLADEAAGIAQGSALASLGWFDPAAVARLAEDHRRGISDHGRLLWQLVMLEQSLPPRHRVQRSPAYRASTK